MVAAVLAAAVVAVACFLSFARDGPLWMRIGLALALGIAVFLIALLAGRPIEERLRHGRSPRDLRIDVTRSSIVGVRHAVEGETEPGFLYMLPELTVVNREEKPIRLRLFLRLSSGGEIEAASTCLQSATGARTHNVEVGSTPHLGLDTRLEADDSVRGHVEFLLHPTRLRLGAKVTGGSVLVIRDVISGNQKEFG